MSVPPQPRLVSASARRVIISLSVFPYIYVLPNCHSALRHKSGSVTIPAIPPVIKDILSPASRPVCPRGLPFYHIRCRFTVGDCSRFLSLKKLPSPLPSFAYCKAFRQACACQSPCLLAHPFPRHVYSWRPPPKGAPRTPPLKKKY